MDDPLASIRRSVQSAADAVRWACVLEATAPKPGNVYPGRSFDDLCYRDFIVAADVAADALCQFDQPLGQRLHEAVRQTRRATGTNVNLGMLLLLAPLVEADRRVQMTGQMPHTVDALRTGTAETLAEITPQDGGEVFAAIRTAAAGGLGKVDRMDVNQLDQPVDLLEAMRSAEQRDRIARQYAGGFSDLFDNVLPVVGGSIQNSGDILAGIVHGQIELLRTEPDSLIARKNGVESATEVQQLATQCDPADVATVQRLDDQLRSRGNQLNPGTTADLIAAALFVLLRCPPDAPLLSS